MRLSRGSLVALLLVPTLAMAQVKAQALPPEPPTSPVLRTTSSSSLRPPRAERVLLEALGGTGAGLVLGVAAGFAGLLIACPSGLKAAPSCLGGIGWAALAGVAVATPVGAFLTGHLLKGGGAFLPTLAGGLIGIGTVLLLAPYTAGILPLLVFGLPVVGSVAGYEISASLHAHPTSSAEPPAVSFGPDFRGGGPAFALTAHF